MPEFRAPSDYQVREALRRTTSPQLRRAFYDGLQNPLWLAPLAAMGAFANPPERVPTGDGLHQDPIWPEIDFLVRVSDVMPEEAVRILLQIGAKENAWIRRAIFAAGAKVPAGQAARLLPIIESFDDSSFGWRSDPRDITAMVVNLLRGGEQETGRWLADRALNPASRNREAEGFADYWYGEALEPILGALGDEALPYALRWLVSYEQMTEGGHGWEFARNRLDFNEAGRGGIEVSLISAVRERAVLAMAQESSNVARLMLSTGMPLIYRLAMVCLRVAVQKGNYNSTDAQRAANMLLFEAEVNDERYRVEFAELVRALVKAGFDLDIGLDDFFKRGPAIERELLRERLRQPDDSPEMAEQRVVEFGNHRLHAWLAAIGRGALPESLKSRLDELDSTEGAIERPLRAPVETRSWVGPNSPIGGADLEAMAAEQLIEHLVSWHASGDGWGPEPSHEGQGRVLAEVVQRNSRIFDDIPQIVGILRPTYLRAILSGWSAALKNSEKLNWVHVASVIEATLLHPLESEFGFEGDEFEDDRDYRGARQAALSLLNQLIRHSVADEVGSELFATFASLLLHQAPMEELWLEYSAERESVSDDALTLSLNASWPISLRGLLEVASCPSGGGLSEGALVLLDSELQRDDVAGASRAVFGEYFGRMLSSQPDWMQEKIPEVFGRSGPLEPLQQVALTTAMAIHYYHRDVYEALEDSMLAALHTPYHLVDGWRNARSTALQRIGEWAVKAVVFGHRAMEQPLQAMFFSSAKPEDRGKAIGVIGWEMIHAQAVDEKLLKATMVLWEQRIAHVHSMPEDHAELAEFFWVVDCKKFDATWWLPKYLEVAQLLPQATEGPDFVEELTRASRELPGEAVRALKYLVTNADGVVRVPWYVSAADYSQIIANGLGAADQELSKVARGLMNSLGEAGDMGLARRVEELRD